MTTVGPSAPIPAKRASAHSVYGAAWTLCDPAADAAPRVGAGASTWRSRVASSMRIGASFGGAGALGTWLVDAVMLASARNDAGWQRWSIGLASALWVGLTTALVVGALLGVVVVPSVSRSMASWRELAGKLQSGSSDARHALIAHALAVSALVPAGAWIAYQVAFATVLGLARPGSMAAALALSQLMFSAILWIVWSPVVGFARLLVDRGAGVVGLRWLTARAWRALGVLGAVPAVVAAALVTVYRTELLAVPWGEGAPLLGFALGIASMSYVTLRRRPWHDRASQAGLFVTVLALLGGGIAAGRLHPWSTTARRLAFESALSGRVGYAAWTELFDFDRDGQLSLLGGGDCAPFDRRRYTGAVDIPGDGIDQDCDGVDLSAMSFHPGARFGAPNRLSYRPSVVVVTIDGLSAQRLVALGSDASLLPHVDELAARSKLFANAFSEGPSTRLSFPSMFTSRWDSQLVHLFAPHHPYPLAPSERQLQDVLNEAGYETVAVVPTAYFDREHWSSVTRGFQRVDGSAMPAGKHNAAEVTDAAIRIFQEPRDRPLYLWVHYYDAHGPYEPLPGVVYSTRSEQELHNAELRHIDAQLARLFSTLDARSEPPYVVVTADHGTVFHPNPSTRRYHYGYDLYTATLHVPLVIHGPNIPAGRIDTLASLMDLAPTITDLLAISDRAAFEGTSLVPEMLGGRRDEGRVLFHEFYLPERDFRGEDPLQLTSARSGRWDLVLDRVRGKYELYDWKADYFEQRDLYEDQGRSPDVLRLRSMVGAFVEQFHRRSPGTALLAMPGGEK